MIRRIVSQYHAMKYKLETIISLRIACKGHTSSTIVQKYPDNLTNLQAYRGLEKLDDQEFI